MHADFRRRENKGQFEKAAMVVLIEMIVLKHVICPNTPTMKDGRYYSEKSFNHFLKPL